MKINHLFSFYTDPDRSTADPLILRKIDEQTAARAKENDDALQEAEDRASLPPVLAFLHWFSLVVGVCLLSSVCIAAIRVGVAAVVDNPFGIAALVVGAVALLLLAVLEVRKRHLESAVTESEEYAILQNAADRIADDCFESLGIPEDAALCDVFTAVCNAKGKPFFALFNQPMYAFSEGDMLCFSDEEVVYGIEKSAITSFSKVRTRVQFMGWNKEEDFRSDAYRPYGISARSGRLFLNRVLSLTVLLNGEEYTVLFPPYEEKTLTALLGKAPEED